MSQKFFHTIAHRFFQYERAFNERSKRQYKEEIKLLCKLHAPSGSGFDRGTSFDFERSKPDHLVFETHFHHMDDNGSYTCWTRHPVTVRPSFIWGVEIIVNGRNHNNIKDYIAEVFQDLSEKLV